jgi:hypothetical protein
MNPRISRADIANLIYGDVDFLAIWLMQRDEQNEQSCPAPHLDQ